MLLSAWNLSPLSIRFLPLVLSQLLGLSLPSNLSVL